MKDNEIIKALECCKNDGIICMECPYKKANGCMEKLSADALDLINRLEARIGIYETCNARKDEAIKHLEAEIVNANCNYDNMRLMYIDKRVEVDRLLISNAEIKAEAIKEFAERLKTEYAQGINWFGVKEHYFVNVEDIDNLVKEMVGKNNDW